MYRGKNTFMKNLWRALLFPFICCCLISCSNSEEADFGLLREQAQKTSTACDNYFDSVAIFASSGGNADSTKTLSENLELLVDELTLMYSNIAVLANAVSNDAEKTTSKDFETFLSLARFERFSEAEMEEFLTVTVQSECSKWSKFAVYSESEISSYFTFDATVLSGRVCEAMTIEVTKQEIYGLMKVEQCDAQSGEGDWHLVVGLNDLIEWIDLDNPPSGQELGDMMFDAPLGLVLESFRNSGVKPSEFEDILIFFRDAESTVYEVASNDLEVVLDSVDKKQALLDLRDKIYISQNS